MDRRAAEDYHEALFREIGKRRYAASNLWWIVAFGASSYWLFANIASVVAGGLLGWAVCAILTRLDDLRHELVRLESLRHLHEHTDEAEVGQVRAKIENDVERLSKRWF